MLTTIIYENSLVQSRAKCTENYIQKLLEQLKEEDSKKLK